MTLKIGITGSIGSGKSTVSQIFESLGVHVFHADLEARKLYDEPEVISKIRKEFGDKIPGESDTINRNLLAQVVFNNKETLEKLNRIIHPLVRAKFVQWSERLSGEPYLLYEAAILFESGYYQTMDKLITVTAPADLRLARVVKRDGSKPEDVQARMKNQWDDESKIKVSDFVIINDEKKMVIPQVLEIHKELLSLAKTSP